jgi:hypothetical protein
MRCAARDVGVGLLIAILALPGAWGDGAYFPPIAAEGEATALSQVRQEAIVAFYRGAAPAFDACPGATPLQAQVSYRDVLTSEADATTTAVYAPRPVALYSYAPAADGEATIAVTTGGFYTDGDTGLQVTLSVHSAYPAMDANRLALSASASDHALTLEVTGGTPYLVRMASSATSTLRTTLTLTGPAAQPAAEDARATYVLRSRYTGQPASFAWVIPVPDRPTGVVALDSGDLFDALDEQTRPQFIILDADGYSPPRGVCGCAMSAGLDAGGRENGALVVVEAAGEAGVFGWAALTSGGSAALLDWLNDNGYAVSATTQGVLQTYIDAGWHFLALRLRDASAVDRLAGDALDIPPIQFTCQTSQRVYPMLISQVTAAGETEVLLYVLGDHRAAGANLSTVEIDAQDLVHDPNSASLSNYEVRFREALAAEDGPVLVSEYASDPAYVSPRFGYGGDGQESPYPALDLWQQAPPEVGQLDFITRLRTLLAPSEMDRDFGFQDAASDTTHYGVYELMERTGEARTALVAHPVGACLAYGAFCQLMRRRIRRAR